jgi:hypothetical protein
MAAPRPAAAPQQQPAPPGGAPAPEPAAAAEPGALPVVDAVHGEYEKIHRIGEGTYGAPGAGGWAGEGRRRGSLRGRCCIGP